MLSLVPVNLFLVPTNNGSLKLGKIMFNLRAHSAQRTPQDAGKDVGCLQADNPWWWLDHGNGSLQFHHGIANIECNSNRTKNNCTTIGTNDLWSYWKTTVTNTISWFYQCLATIENAQNTMAITITIPMAYWMIWFWNQKKGRQFFLTSECQQQRRDPDQLLDYTFR